MVNINKPKIRAGERPAVKYAVHAAGAFEREGEEALANIAKTQHELGAEYARDQIKELGIKGNDARAAGAVFKSLLQDMAVEHRVIEGTNKRFVVHTRGCPFLKEWKKEGKDAPVLCESFGKSFVQGICESVNPKLRYNVTKMMSRGDPYCEERIELGY